MRPEFTVSQTMGSLKRAEAGSAVPEVCRMKKLEVRPQPPPPEHGLGRFHPKQRLAMAA